MTRCLCFCPSDADLPDRSLTLFDHDAGAGVQIPYPSISLHALNTLRVGEGQFQVVWMQIAISANEDEGDELELTIVPPEPATGEPEPDGPARESPGKQLYEAVSACSNLHPDPLLDDDDDDDYETDDRIIFEGDHEALEGFTGVMRGSASGGLPPPMPGSSGWITAENVHEYFDADGNWIGDGENDRDEAESELGEGSGRVRGRDEMEDNVNGHGPDDDAGTKRPRV